MPMNPLEQTGIPVADQFRPWSEMVVEPFDTATVDPYTRTRVANRWPASRRSRTITWPGPEEPGSSWS